MSGFAKGLRMRCRCAVRLTRRKSWLLAMLLAAPSFAAPSGLPPKVSFEVLAGFPYEPGDPKAPPTIPESIRALDGTRVVVTGYMVPTRLEGTAVKEFLLVRSPMMCCFGATPQLNEWVQVVMEKPVAYLPDVPRSVGGVLHVGETYDNGYLTGLYRVDGESFGDEAP